MFLVYGFTLIFRNEIMIFVDNYWMTRISGCFSVLSTLPNTERYWSSLLVLQFIVL